MRIYNKAFLTNRQGKDPKAIWILVLISLFYVFAINTINLFENCFIIYPTIANELLLIYYSTVEIAMIVFIMSTLRKIFTNLQRDNLYLFLIIYFGLLPFMGLIYGLILQ